MVQQKSNKDDPLDTFGRFVMADLRDRAIEFHDNLAKGHWKAPNLGMLQADLESLGNAQTAIVRRCVIAAIDTAIHDFLFKLQEIGDLDGHIRVLVNDIDISTVSDGLHGELFTENGWMAKYSKYGEPRANA